jgi:predicted RNA polymerase sigma factor
MKLGRYAEAREEFQRAIGMTENRREHELLSEKLKQAAPIVLKDAPLDSDLDQ